jgi:hypothetical protein
MRGRGARWLFAWTLIGAAAPAAAFDLDEAKSFDWQRKTPRDFLDLLRRQAKLPPLVGTFASVDGTHAGFVREEHLADLVSLVDSKETCAHVATPAANTLPRTRSFVGQEALVLIQGFRDGTYPPKGLATSEGFYGRKDEILGWWSAREAPLATATPPARPR